MTAEPTLRLDATRWWARDLAMFLSARCQETVADALLAHDVSCWRATLYPSVADAVTAEREHLLRCRRGPDPARTAVALSADPVAQALQTVAVRAWMEAQRDAYRRLFVSALPRHLENLPDRTPAEDPALLPGLLLAARQLALTWRGDPRWRPEYAPEWTP